jgi:hypothetical protein
LPSVAIFWRRGEVSGFALAPLEIAELREDLDRTGLRLRGVDQPRFEGIP